jgi:hypothetical protein
MPDKRTLVNLSPNPLRQTWLGKSGPSTSPSDPQRPEPPRGSAAFEIFAAARQWRGRRPRQHEVPQASDSNREMLSKHDTGLSLIPCPRVRGPRDCIPSRRGLTSRRVSERGGVFDDAAEAIKTAPPSISTRLASTRIGT